MRCDGTRRRDDEHQVTPPCVEVLTPRRSEILIDPVRQPQEPQARQRVRAATSPSSPTATGHHGRRSPCQPACADGDVHPRDEPLAGPSAPRGRRPSSAEQGGDRPRSADRRAHGRRRPLRGRLNPRGETTLYLGERPASSSAWRTASHLPFRARTLRRHGPHPQLYRPDLALLPIGGHFTMGRGSRLAVELLGSTRWPPYHWGTFRSSPTPEALRRELDSRIARGHGPRLGPGRRSVNARAAAGSAAPADFPCRFCGAACATPSWNLARRPRCEAFVAPEDAERMDPFKPLHVRISRECLLEQLPAFVDRGGDLPGVRYFSSYAEQRCSTPALGRR